MSFIRSRLISCALALLACQLGLSAAAPVALCRAGAPVTADPGGISCTCAHGAGAECPMHRGKAQVPAGQADTSRCCSGCTEQMVVMLSALAGSVGMLQPSETTADPMISGAAPAALAVHPVHVVRSPASPPPRS